MGLGSQTTCVPQAFLRMDKELVKLIVFFLPLRVLSDLFLWLITGGSSSGLFMQVTGETTGCKLIKLRTTWLRIYLALYI